MVAMASENLLQGDGTIDFMVRDAPDFEGDSGWVIFSTSNIGVDDLQPVSLNDLMDYYPALATVVMTPAPCEFEWVEGLQQFRPLKMSKIL